MQMPSDIVGEPADCVSQDERAHAWVWSVYVWPRMS